MRVYLDYNATTPLRAEARQAMIAAMDVIGNPSSVHAEGRAAKALLEKARADLGEAVGVSGQDIVFTSGASEAAALALHGRGVRCSGLEHPSVLTYCNQDIALENGLIADEGENIARQLANSETGILQKKARPVWFEDAVQAFGKIPYAFSWRRAQTGAISAHKIGGPKGVGALLMDASLDLDPLLRGGGQEGSRRAGTENLIGIAGFAAAAKAAQRDLEAGRWEEVEDLRNWLEEAILTDCKDAIVVGKDMARLPNTSNIITTGWKSELQVMQMDLAGFAISAGSACSSGKVKRSESLLALGYDQEQAASGIRISLGLETTKAQLEAFVGVWLTNYHKWRNRAA